MVIFRFLVLSTIVLSLFYSQSTLSKQINESDYLNLFRNIYNRNNALPVEALPAEIEQARTKLCSESAVFEELALLNIIYQREIKKLRPKFIFCENKNCLQKIICKNKIITNKYSDAAEKSLEYFSMFMRDSDGDGILDYRIDESAATVYEGDNDVDGDGIRNVFDSDPYNKNIGGIDNDNDGIPDLNFTDVNQNKIPDHVDWEITKADNSKIGISIQQKWFNKHQILFVDSTSKFSEEQIKLLDLALSLFSDDKFPPLLKVISADTWVFDTEAGDDGTLAMAENITARITLFSGAIKSQLNARQLINVLLTFVHEFNHSLHFSLDNNRQILDLCSKGICINPNFDRVVSQLGWDVTPNPEPIETLYKSVVPTWSSVDINNYTANTEATDHAPSLYSISSPEEYWGESYIAFLDLEIEDSIDRLCPNTHEILKELFAKQQLETENWNVNYRKSKGSKMLAYLNANYPVNKWVVDKITRSYVIPILSDECR